MTEAPNHALQRTAPGVTAPAPRRPTAQEPRRPPQSLSLLSFGDTRRAMTFLKLLFITACCHVVGTAGLAAVMSWPKPESVLSSVLFSPLMAIAGWPMALIILLLVLLMLGVYQQALARRRFLFVLTGTLVGAGVGLLFAQGDLTLRSEPWGLAYFVGSSLAGTLSNAMILALFTAPNKSAAPNGGPATQLGSSGVTEGPPSVS